MTSTLSHDLLPTILQYLDRQLTIELLARLMEEDFQHVYDPIHLSRLKLDVVSKTKMYGEAHDLSQALLTGEDRDKRLAELSKKERELIESHNALITSDTGVGLYFTNVVCKSGQDQLKAMMLDHTLALEGMDTFVLKPKHLAEILAFARHVYEYGQNVLCSQVLRFLRLVDPTTYKSHSGRLWGQVASGILCCCMEEEGASWKETCEDLMALNEAIDITTCELNTALYFLHWSLFVFLSSRIPTGREQLVEVFMSDKYINIIRTSAPHLMRYVCVALLTVRGPRRGSRMSPILKSLREFFEGEPFTYRDPIIDVVILLFVQGNANEALERLKDCDAVLSNDCFLSELKSEFIECMRRFCFEDVCRLHQTVDLKHIATMLNCTLPEAERWIVNVIRPARITARVDSVRQVLCVQAEATTPSASHLIMDKTQLLSFRVQSLHKTCMDSRVQTPSEQNANNKNNQGEYNAHKNTHSHQQHNHNQGGGYQNFSKGSYNGTQNSYNSEATALA